MNVKIISQFNSVVSSVTKKDTNYTGAKFLALPKLSNLEDTFTSTKNQNENFAKKVYNSLNKISPKSSEETSDDFLIAKMSRKIAYSNAGEKLSDIWLDLKTQNEYTGVLDNNIEAYNQLPEVIKKALTPDDVDYYGHISQYKIDKLYEEAKNANLISSNSYPPSFHGTTEQVLQNSVKNGEQILAETLDTNTPDLTDNLTDNIKEITTPDIDLPDESVLTTLKEGLEHVGKVILEFLQDALS